MLSAASPDGTASLPLLPGAGETRQTNSSGAFQSRICSFSQEHRNGSHTQALRLSKPGKHSAKVFCFAVRNQNVDRKRSSSDVHAANLETSKATTCSLLFQGARAKTLSRTGRNADAIATNRFWVRSHSVSAMQSDRCGLHVRDVLGVRTDPTYDSEVLAEYEDNDVDTGLDSPFKGKITVLAGTATDFDVPWVGESEIGHFQEAIDVADVATINTDVNGNFESSGFIVKHVNNGHTKADSPSSQKQLPRQISSSVDEAMSDIRGGIDGVAVLSNQVGQVKCSSSRESEVVISLIEGSGLGGLKDSAASTGASANSDVTFDGFQSVDVENAHTRTVNSDCQCTSQSQVQKATVVSDKEQSDGSMADTDGLMPGFDRLGILKHCDKDNDPASPSMVEGKKVTDSVVSPSKVMALRMPVYRLPAHLQGTLDDSVRYLEELGVDCAKMFESEPRTKACGLKQIKGIVSALNSYGLKDKDAGRVFLLCPKVLFLDRDKDIKLVTDFLFNEAGVPPQEFQKVMRRCPKLLIIDLNTHLRPTLKFLHTLGYVNIGHTIANTPALLSYDVHSRILPRLRLLESWGFTYREAAAIAVRFPAVFNYSAVKNLQRKYDYLVNEIGATRKDLLAFPQYFGYSLQRRIHPRYQCIAKLNVSLSLEAMLTISDAAFKSKFLRGSQARRALKGSSKSLSFANSEKKSIITV